MTSTTVISAAIVALAAIAAATVAVVTGHIDGQSFVAVVGPLAGVFVGIGAHAAGVNQAQP
jgi:hypothetical protein